MKLYIGTARDIGERCKAWARDNLPAEVELTEDMDQCDVFISVLYPKLLSPRFLNKGRTCFNFHPGVLPKYRGAGASSWAIVNGEIEAGVTLHVIDEGIDTGAILDIVKFTVRPNDTAGVVFNSMEGTIEYMFKQWLPRLCTGGTLVARDQPSEGRTYFRKDLEDLKDLSKIVRALTFRGKESAYFINSRGEKIYIDYYAAAS